MNQLIYEDIYVMIVIEYNSKFIKIEGMFVMNIVIKGEGFRSLPLSTLPGLVDDVAQKYGKTPIIRAVMLDIVFEDENGELIDKLDQNGKPLIAEAIVRATPKDTLLKSDALMLCKVTFVFSLSHDNKAMEYNVKNDFSEISGLRIVNSVKFLTDDGVLQAGKEYEAEIKLVFHKDTSLSEFIQSVEDVVSKSTMYQKTGFHSIKECPCPA